MKTIRTKGDFLDISVRDMKDGSALICETREPEYPGDVFEGQYIFVNREQAAQLAEVLKRYSETGRIDE